MVGLLFDNDGVLIDSSALHWLSWQMLMQEEKQLLMDEAMFLEGFGKRNDLILAETAPEMEEKERVRIATRKEELFREYAKGKLTLLPGMEAFLKEVVAAKVPRIIASSTPVENLQMFLASTVLGEYFDCFVSAEEVDEGKPAPDIFLEAASRLGLPAEECIVIEDSPAGLLAGRRAGCFVVALETSHSKAMLSDFDVVYSSAKELRLASLLEAFDLWKKK